MRENLSPPKVYDFDRNRPILDAEDEAILDRVWDRIAHEGPVEDLAAELWQQANTYVPRVVKQGDNATDVPPHIRKMIRMQPVDDPRQFQLPEVIQGPVLRPECLVIGQNPGLDPQSIFPTWGCDLEEYVSFHRKRFISTHRHPESGLAVDCLQSALKSPRTEYLKIIPHYRAVEDLLAERFGTRSIGRNVTYIDAVPWKSLGKQFGKVKASSDPDVKRLAEERIARVLLRLQPRYVITLGKFAADRLGSSLPTLTLRTEQHVAVNGTQAWTGVTVPLYHPNSRRVQVPDWYWKAISGFLAASLREEVRC
jgi:hypothetical protein